MTLLLTVDDVGGCDVISLEVDSRVADSEAVDAASEGLDGSASSEGGHVHKAPASEVYITNRVKNF